MGEKPPELDKKDDDTFDLGKEVFNPYLESQRPLVAAELGLSQDATWEQINLVGKQKEREEKIHKFGLLKSASDKEIYDAATEFERKETVIKLGLPPDANWSQINDKKWELECKGLIEEFGLPEDTPFDDIEKILKSGKYRRVKK